MPDYRGLRVKPRGPIPNPILLLGEAPGKTEAFRTGTAFTGVSGRALDDWLQHLGIADPYITNMTEYRCFDPDDPMEDVDPDDQVIEENRPRLIREIMECRPTCIVTMGRVATRWITGQDYRMEEVSGKILDIADKHRTWLTWDCWVRPVYHPAAGFHQPALMAQTLIGLSELAVNRDIPNRAHLGQGKTPIYDCIAIDTEGTVRHPVCLSYCYPKQKPVVLWCDDPRFKEKLADLKKYIIMRNLTVICHYLMHDWQVLRAMGMDLGEMGVRTWDTMVGLWHITDPSMGLKVAGPRWLGVEMREYMEVVGPYLHCAWMEWWEGTMELVQPHIKRVQVFTEKTKKPKMKGGQPVYKLEGYHRDLALAAMYDKLQAKEVATLKDYEDRRDAIIALDPDSAPEAFLPPRAEHALTLVPRDEAETYAGEDASTTLGLYTIITPPKTPRYMHLDQECLPIFAEMEARGMRLDLDRARVLHDEITAQTEELRVKVMDLMPQDCRDINIGSTDQLAAAWFDKMGMVHTGKLTKTGKRKMDDALIAQLKDQHPVVQAYLEWNTSNTLRTTFSGPLVGYAERAGGRLHPRLKTGVVPSGRPSMQDPNLLAYPARTKMGRRVRSCFPATDGHVMSSIDLSQIELRLMAALSGDPVMLDAFRNNKDLHQITADKNGISRQDAKTVNFAVIYLCSPPGLYDQMKAADAKVLQGLTRDQGIECCDSLIKGWNRTYEGVPDYAARVKAYILNHGYIRSTSDRVWHLPAALLTGSRAEFMREEAFRQGTNFTIQGAAQDGEKTAIIGAKRLLQEAELWLSQTFPLLTIYDELLMETVIGWEEAVCEIVKEVKSHCCDWMWGLDLGYTRVSEVPVGAEYKTAGTWGECK